VGQGQEAAIYDVDGRDVVAGTYEAVAASAPGRGSTLSIAVDQSPMAIGGRRARDGVELTLRNLSPDPVTTDPFVAVVGAERGVNLVANGSDERRIPFVIPAWAVHCVVDVSMDQDQWSRFTDFGVTLFDSAGHQIAKSPLNYRFGRLHAELQRGETAAYVGLFPGFADSTGDLRWTASVSIRLYADSASVTRSTAPEVTLAPGAAANATAAMPETPLPMGDGFFPLGILVAPLDERPWTREMPLPPPTPPLAR